MKFRNYQLEIIEMGTDILWKKGLVYLAMEVRTGKTLTALGICSESNATNVLFITKKRAIPSIQSDFEMLGKDFRLTIINYESLHKVESPQTVSAGEIPFQKFDIIICDEAHCLGAFAKYNKRSKQVKDLLARHQSALILLSGTPTPESFSQIYHQVWGHPQNPFSHYKNFYAWAKDYVNIKQKRIRGNWVNDYSSGKEQKILDAMQPYMLSYTQKQAGWVSRIEEEVLTCSMSNMTHKICQRLRLDKVFKGREDVILADTGVKLMSKLHQLYSGTIILESGDHKIIDYSKAEFIAKKFWGDKIAIFYKFTSELEAIKEVFGKDNITQDVEEFDKTHKNIALQIVSGREGISLKEADFLVYYNIDFSATSYWQSRDRMSTKTRCDNKIYWIFSDGGIEEKIYKVVNSKKNYTLKHFTEDLNKYY